MIVTVPDWVIAPPAEVTLAWESVERTLAGGNTNLYLVGCAAAFRWALGAEPKSPLDRRLDLRPTHATVLVEDMRATAIVAGDPDPGDELLSPVVASGVANTLGWLTGAVRACPVRWDHRVPA